MAAPKKRRRKTRKDNKGDCRCSLIENNDFSSAKLARKSFPDPPNSLLLICFLKPLLFPAYPKQILLFYILIIINSHPWVRTTETVNPSLSRLLDIQHPASSLREGENRPRAAVGGQIRPQEQERGLESALDPRQVQKGSERVADPRGKGFEEVVRGSRTAQQNASIWPAHQ